jgi:signal transduction histidine kinase
MLLFFRSRESILRHITNTFQTNFRFFGMIAFVFSFVAFFALDNREKQFAQTQMLYESRLVGQQFVNKQTDFNLAMGRMAGRLRYQGSYRAGKSGMLDEWKKDALIYVQEFTGLEAVMYVDTRMKIEGVVSRDRMPDVVGKSLADYPDMRVGLEESGSQFSPHFGDGAIPFFAGNLFYGIFPVVRFDNFVGYVVAILNYDTWLKEAFPDSKYEVKLFSGNRLRFEKHSTGSADATNTFLQEVNLPGLNWRLSLYPVSSSFWREFSLTPYLVLFAGIIISMLFWLYAYLQRELDKNKVKNFDAARLQDIANVVAGLTHEVNNPLAIIQGAVFQLQRYLQDRNSNRQRSIDCAEKIDRSAQRIGKIVEGLKIFAGEQTKEIYELTTVHDVTTRLHDMCKLRMEQHGVHFETRDFTRNTSFECIESKLLRALMEILNNAYDAVWDKPEKTVRLEVQEVEGQIQFAITDSGAGVPDHLRSKLMNPFFTTKDVGKGTGLGLSIAAGFARGHGGRLYLDENSRATRFVVIFPKTQSSKALGRVS